MNRLNRPEKSKSCEKCDEYERILDSERKSNTQLKKMVEQKENQKSQTSNSDSCSNCSDLKQLLDIEKQNNQQLTQQFQNQKKQTEEERNAKQVLFISEKKTISYSFFNLDVRTSFRISSIRFNSSKKNFRSFTS